MKQIKILEADLVLSEIEDPKARYDDMLIFETSLNDEDFSEFRSYVVEKNGEYFECEIDGIKKIARFGIVSHRVNSDGFLVRGPIVEKGQREPESKQWYDGDFKNNMIRENLKNKIIIERLVELLLDKSVITEEEIDKLTDVSRGKIVAAHFDQRTF